MPEILNLSERTKARDEYNPFDEEPHSLQNLAQCRQSSTVESLRFKEYVTF